MNKSKFNVFLTIFVVLILSCFPCSVNASNGISNHLLYRIENNTVIITGYTGNDKVLVIPCQIDDRDVVCIDEMAFTKNEEIWAVILPQTVTEIRAYAFHYSGLREIVLPKSLQSWNMILISFTFGVLKSIVTFVNFLHPLNMNAIVVAFDVTNEDRFKDVNDSHSLNI